MNVRSGARYLSRGLVVMVFLALPAAAWAQTVADAGASGADSLKPCTESKECPEGERCIPQKGAVECSKSETDRTCSVNWTSVCRRLNLEELESASNLQVGCDASGEADKPAGSPFVVLALVMVIIFAAGVRRRIVAGKSTTRHEG